MSLTTAEVNILRGYCAGKSLADIAHTSGVDQLVVEGIVRRLGFERRRANELLRQHQFGMNPTIPGGVHAPAAPSKPAPAVAAPPARAAARDEAGPHAPAPARAAGRSGAGDGLKAPRRTDPRPAGDRALGQLPADVGGDDADGEVTAVPEATGAAVTEPTPADALTAREAQRYAELVDRVLDRALYCVARWYCPRCHYWPPAPGACESCRAPLQPVYLATLPRETTP